MSSRTSRQLFPEGDMISHYKVIHLIGQGGYGDIYSVLDCDPTTNQPVPDAQLLAMKIESLSSQKQGLSFEHEVMLRIQGSTLFPRLIDFGTTLTHRYLVMELKGPSLSNTRRQLPNHRYTIGTALRLSIFMLECIQKYHSCGYLHRDIKPGNFLLYSNSSNPLVLIDYGLSRAYINFETGEMLEQRSRAGFRGTSKYASISTHEYRDACRRDDLIMWAYSLVELVDGKLPWSPLHDSDKILRMKKQISNKDLFRSFPSEMNTIWRYINKLTFYETPNYQMIIGYVAMMMQKTKSLPRSPFDWESFSPDKIASYSPITELPKVSELTEIKVPDLHIVEESSMTDEVSSRCSCYLI